MSQDKKAQGLRQAIGNKNRELVLLQTQLRETEKERDGYARALLDVAGTLVTCPSCETVVELEEGVHIERVETALHNARKLFR